MSKVLSIDIGASSGRFIVLSYENGLFSSKEIYFLYIFKSIKYSGNTVFKEAPHSCKNLINWQYCSLIWIALLPKSVSKTEILPGGSFPIRFFINM